MAARWIIALLIACVTPAPALAERSISGPIRYLPPHGLQESAVHSPVAAAVSDAGTVLAVWAHGEVRGTRLRSDGSPVDVPNLVVGATWAAAGHVDVVAIETGFLVVWTSRLGVHTAVVDDSGLVRSGTILPESDWARSASVAWNGTEGLVVWEGPTQLHAATIGANGYQKQRVTLHEGARPDLVATPDGWLIGYAVDEVPAASNIELVRLTRELEAGEPLRLWRQGEESRLYSTVRLSAGQDATILVTSEGGGLRWAVFTPTSGRLGPVHELQDVPRSAAVALPDGWLLSWTSYRSERLHLGRLDQRGAMVVQAGPVDTSATRPAPALIGTPHGTLLIHGVFVAEFIADLVARSVDPATLELQDPHVLSWNVAGISRLLMEGLSEGYVLLWDGYSSAEGTTQYFAFMDERGSGTPPRQLPSGLGSLALSAPARDRILVVGSRPFALLLDSAGNVVASYDLPGPALALATDGERFLLAWRSASDAVRFQLVDRDGQARETDLTLSASQGDVGSFWMAWTGSRWLLSWVEYRRMGSHARPGPLFSGTLDHAAGQLLTKHHLRDEVSGLDAAWSADTALVVPISYGEPATALRLDSHGQPLGTIELPSEGGRIFGSRGDFLFLWRDEDLHLDRIGREGTMLDRIMLERDTELRLLRMAESGQSLMVGGLERYFTRPGEHEGWYDRIALWRVGEQRRRGTRGTPPPTATPLKRSSITQ